MKAREALSAGRDIIAQLVAQFPDWPQWKRELTRSNRRIATLTK